MSEPISFMKKLSSVEVVAQSKEYTRKRMTGEIGSLKTKFGRLNKALLGGLEHNTITTISALSGAGKSTISKCFRDSFVTENPKVKFKQYVFNFEMSSHSQIARSVVSASQMSLNKLYSVDEPLTPQQFKNLDKYYDELATRDIDFIDVPSTPESIVRSLVHYWETECKADNITMIYELDHTLLVKGVQGQSERSKIDSLMYLLVEAKKYIASQGGNSIGLVLCQMNREIRKTERVQNADMHRPGTECLFGASSIEQCSDYIIISHIPAKLGIESYTTDGLPTKMMIDGEVLQIPYFELVKNRSGAPDLTFPMWNKLAFFDFDEMEVEVFKEMYTSFRDTGQIPVVKKQKQLF